MTQAAAAVFKFPTESPQLARGAVSRARRAAPKRKVTGLAAGRVVGAGGRVATRGGGEVIELGLGITVYPPRDEGGRWRAVWLEGGERRQCESVSEEKLAVKLEKVRQRLAAGASGVTRPGADLIAWYLSPDRLPAERRWSRRHADSQRRLCQRFAAPVIASVTCLDITTAHTQRVVNAALTAGAGGRVHRMLSALTGAGVKGGYLVNPALAEVHWQAGDRPVPAPAAGVAGESSLWVDPAEVPSADDVAVLGKALSAMRGAGRADGQPGRLQRAALGRAGRADHRQTHALPITATGRTPERIICALPLRMTMSAATARNRRSGASRPAHSRGRAGVTVGRCRIG